MKIKLTFEYDEEVSVEKERLQTILNADKLQACLEYFDEQLRSKIKYTEEKGSFEEAREMFHLALKEYDISLF